MSIYKDETGRRIRYPLEFKAQVVATAIKEDLNEYEIARRFDIGITAAQNWMISKNWILESYCERQRLKENPQGPIIVHGKNEEFELLVEDCVPRKINAADAVKELKAEKRRNEYLEDKVAYYDALLDVLGIVPTQVQKKTAMRRLEEQQKKEEQDT